MANEKQIENIVDAIDRLAESIDGSVEDEYHRTKTSSHLYNIAYSLEEIANTLKKIEAKMK